MKTRKIVLVLLFAFSVSAFAVEVIGEGFWGLPITLHCEKIRVGSTGGGIPRYPVEIPEASLDDHTLYIGTAFSDDVTVQLVNVDDVTGGETVEYSTVLYAGDQTVVFPSTLSGTYELRIIVDWYYLAGEVEL